MHTKEPWTACEHSDSLHAIRDEKGRIVADVGYSATHEVNYANARRIVACVNACAGIGTERLEDMNRPLMNHLFGADAHAASLVQQRDELLAAIKVARECIATDRDSLYETHRNPNTNTVDDAFGLDGLADYDAVLDWIDAVVSKAEAA